MAVWSAKFVWGCYDPRIADTKELNGLGVMMALLNNWALKAENDSLQDQGGSSRRYFVSDVDDHIRSHSK